MSNAVSRTGGGVWAPLDDWHATDERQLLGRRARPALSRWHPDFVAAFATFEP